MSFRLEPPRSIEFQIRLATTGRVDDAICRLERLTVEDHAAVVQAVHTVRRRSKQARAVARLARCALGPDFTLVNRSLRDASRALAPLRSAHVRSSLVSDSPIDLVPDRPDRSKGSGNERSKKKRVMVANPVPPPNDPSPTAGHDAIELAVDEALTALYVARAGIDRWQIPDDFDLIAAGLRRTYTRGRRNLRRSMADPNDDQFHEWRKDVKALWYQVRMVQACAPRVLDALVADLDEIGRLLGRDQDLRLLPVESDLTIAAAAGERARLRSRSIRLGTIVFAESPECFGSRLSAYWAADQEFGPIR